MYIILAKFSSQIFFYTDNFFKKGSKPLISHASSYFFTNGCQNSFESVFTLQNHRWAHNSFFHRVGFCSLLPELFGEQFSLLSYKPCHSGVIWTEEKAGNSEVTLSAGWFKPLHKVLQCQNILKTRRNKQAK